MKRFLPCFALLLSSLAQANDTEVAKGLIGYEHIVVAPAQPFPGRPGCINQGGAVIYTKGVFSYDWGNGIVICDGRPILFLERYIDTNPADRVYRARIVDAVVLPRYELDADPRRPNARRLFETGDCELNGRTDTSFMAIVRWGKRERIDHRTGVEAAWGFDTERGRIVRLDTKRIVCWRPEPD